jgi:hypothetical protein
LDFWIGDWGVTLTHLGRELLCVKDEYQRRFGGMKDTLMDFQLEVEKGINDVLDHLGKHVVDRRVAGIAETYITGSVSDQDIVFWIYPNGAALLVGRRHRAFGFPKRESLLDTAREFLDAFLRQ